MLDRVNDRAIRQDTKESDPAELNSADFPRFVGMSGGKESIPLIADNHEETHGFYTLKYPTPTPPSE